MKTLILEAKRSVFNGGMLVHLTGNASLNLKLVRLVVALSALPENIRKPVLCFQEVQKEISGMK